MNRIVIKGRISSEIECRVTETGKEVYSFSVAVNRRFNMEQTDFFNCIAWEKTGAFVNQYFTKGQEILLAGEMQCRKWQDKGGNNRYTWELIVSETEFCGSKKDGANCKSAAAETVTVEDVGEFEEIDDDEEVPF